MGVTITVNQNQKHNIPSERDIQQKPWESSLITVQKPFSSEFTEHVQLRNTLKNKDAENTSLQWGLISFLNSVEHFLHYKENFVTKSHTTIVSDN